MSFDELTPDETRAYNRDWYAKNRDSVLARQKGNPDNAPKQARYRVRKRSVSPAYFRDRQLQLKYGITFEQMQQMLVAQDYKCRVCEASIDEVTGHVDHDHQTNVVRGLLCVRCNIGIGQFLDSPDVLREAALYLESFNMTINAPLKEII
jgi:hypothetical protein